MFSQCTGNQNYSQMGSGCCNRLVAEGLLDFARHLFTHNLRELIDGRKLYPLHRSEHFEKRSRAFLANPLNEIQLGLQCALTSQRPVIGDCEPVCLIANSLEKLESGRSLWNRLRIRDTRKKYFFESFGQSDDPDFGFRILDFGFWIPNCGLSEGLLSERIGDWRWEGWEQADFLKYFHGAGELT